MPDLQVVPVFPLPDVVFFPRTTLPLHIFEPRYRTMVKDAMGADLRIAIALLRPGWRENYHQDPAYLPIATIGRIEGLEQTRDGRFYFRLVGEARVRLAEVVRDAPYRLARYARIPERPVDEDQTAVRRAKLDLLASQGCLMRELTGSELPGLVFDEGIPLEVAVNGACSSLPADPSIRQSLLEIDDILERHRRVSDLLDEVLQRVLHLKSLRSVDEGGSGVN